MNQETLPDDLRRFILTIPSIPYLEAMLLLRSKPMQAWDMETVGQRLYIAKEQAGNLLRQLCAAHICMCIENHSTRFIYKPESRELDSLITSLASVYTENLIEITNL